MRQIRLNIVPFLQFLLDTLLPANMHPKFPPALPHSQLDLLNDLRIMSDSLLALGGKRNPHRRDMHHDHNRPARQCPPALTKSVTSPVRIQHRLENRTSRLLIQQRNTIGDPRNTHDRLAIRGFVLFLTLFRSIPKPVCKSGFDQERITTINRRLPRTARIKIRIDNTLKPVDHILFTDRPDTIAGRITQLRLTDRLMQRLRFLKRYLRRLKSKTDLRRLAYIPGHRSGHP